MASLLASVANKSLVSEELLAHDSLKEGPNGSPNGSPEPAQKGSSSKGSSSRPEQDVEAREALMPGLDITENERRWGFIQKVYGIVGAQLVLTAVVGSCFAFIPELHGFALTSPWFFYVAISSPFVAIIPLYFYRHSHPHNLVLLALWTACIEIIMGLECSTFQGTVVAQALALAAIVVLSLTAYTFHAVKKGQDFSFLGPMLFASLVTLVAWSLIQLVFQPGDITNFGFALLGGLFFSLYIVYDTESLIKRFSYDEYVWASVNLFLDIINPFLYLLRLFNHR